MIGQVVFYENNALSARTLEGFAHRVGAFRKNLGRRVTNTILSFLKMAIDEMS